MKRKLVILGASGLLGASVLREAERNSIPVLGISRDNMSDLDQKLKSPKSLLEELGVKQKDVVVNAIGKTKQLIDLSSHQGMAEARWINAVFPGLLAEACKFRGAKVIQVGTDCVFSGASGNYTEVDRKDAEDFYGTTKSLGENFEYMSILRTSFVGDHSKSNPGLWHWVKKQQNQAKIIGYTNHFWNGCTVDALAKVLAGAFADQAIPLGVNHIVPQDSVSKFELVNLIAKRIGRDDIRVHHGEAEIPKDMRLATNDAKNNAAIWELGGFGSPPNISEMIAEQMLFP